MPGLTRPDRYRSPVDGRWVERRTVRYGATTIDHTRRRYQADAAIYASSGWAVHHLAWDPLADRPTLVATYARYEGPASLTDLIFGAVEAVTAGPLVQATVIASLLVTTSWLLLSGLGYLLGSTIGLDVGVPLLLAGLAVWVLVVRAVLRARGLEGLRSWAVVGIVSFVLSVPLWILVMLVISVEILDFR